MVSNENGLGYYTILQYNQQITYQFYNIIHIIYIYYMRLHTYIYILYIDNNTHYLHIHIYILSHLRFCGLFDVASNWVSSKALAAGTTSLHPATAKLQGWWSRGAEAQKIWESKTLGSESVCDLDAEKNGCVTEIVFQFISDVCLLFWCFLASVWCLLDLGWIGDGDMKIGLPWSASKHVFIIYSFKL